MCRASFGHVGLGQGSAGVKYWIACRHRYEPRRKAQYLPFTRIACPFHDKQTHITFGCGGKVLLGNHEAITTDRVDHLIDIGDVVWPH